MGQEPIKIRWTGDARTKLITRNLTPRYEDGEEGAGLARRTLAREKTNVVVQSEREAQELLRGLEMILWRVPETKRGEGCSWLTASHKKAYERVHEELIEEMETRGWE